MSEEKKNAGTSGKKTPEQIVIETRARLDEIVGKSSKGKLVLSVPIRADGTDVNELSFDFTALTGWEYMDALDKAGNAKPDAFRITSKQALALFAAAAAKETPNVDEEDIIGRISPQDGIAAMQVASLFFNASSRAGDMRTMKT